MSSFSFVWSSHIWLPPNVTWESFQDKQEYAKFSDLLIPLPLAFLLILLRSLLDLSLFRPVGRLLGINGKPRRMPSQNLILESAYNNGEKDIGLLCSSSGLSARQVESWMRQKQLAAK